MPCRVPRRAPPRRDYGREGGLRGGYWSWLVLPAVTGCACRSFFLPRDSGEGGPSCTAGWWKGRGTQRISFDESETASQTPPPPRFARSPSPAIAGADAHHRSRAALFVRAPSFAKSFHERASQEHDPEKCSRFSDQIMPPKGEPERRKAHTRDRSAQSGRCRPGGFAARAILFFPPPCGERSGRGRARLPALYRGSRQVLRLGSVRSRASWSRITIRAPGSQLLADLRRGRPGEFPNRLGMRSRTPSRAPLPLHQSTVTG